MKIPFVSRKTGRWTPYLGLIAALVIGLALRLVNIGAEPYWGDEILSLDIASTATSVKELVRYLGAVEFHPPLYYLMIRPWAAFFGAGEASIRALSVIGGLGTIAAAYALAMATLRSRRAAVYGALFVAILPVQVEFGQEARPYALMACACTVGAFALWKALRTRRNRWWILYVAAMLVAVYLHYSAFLVVFATAAWGLIEVWRDAEGERSAAFLRWLVAHAAMFLGFFPWLSAVFYRILVSRMVFFGQEATSLATRPFSFMPQTWDMLFFMSQARELPLLEHLAQSLAKIAVALGAFVTVRRYAAVRPFARRDDVPWAAAYLAWLTVVPALLFLVSPLSLPYAPVWVRHALFVTVPAMLLLGHVGASLRPRVAMALFAVVFAAMLTPLTEVLGNDAEWSHHHRIGEVGTYITAHSAPGDLVILAYDAARSDLAHYLPASMPMESMLPIPYYGNDFWRTRNRLGFLENEGQLRSALDKVGVSGGGPESAVKTKLERLVKLHSPSRVWLYSFSNNDTFVHGWFADHGWRRAFRSIEGIFALDLYVAPEPPESASGTAPAAP